MPLSDAEVLELRKKLCIPKYLNKAVDSIVQDFLEGKKQLVEFKRCCRCKEYLPVDKFPFNRSEKDQLNSYCRTCCREYREERLLKKKASPYLNKAL